MKWAIMAHINTRRSLIVCQYDLCDASRLWLWPAACNRSKRVGQILVHWLLTQVLEDGGAGRTVLNWAVPEGSGLVYGTM
jgi:hypothetical protein